MPVDTAKVEGRRKVDYASLDELLADAERFGTGPVKALGNWSPGQIYRHLAISLNSSIDGFRMSFPWHFRVMGKVFKKKLLAGQMPPGFKIPPDAVETFEPAPTSNEEGLAELRAAVARVKNETKRAKHPVLGDLTLEQWNRAYLQHASLHMSYLVSQ